jgi:DNA repair protein RadA/Sms
VLFIMTEEPPERLKGAVLRMTSNWAAAEVKKAMGNLLVETGMHDWEMLPGYFAQHVLNPSGAYHGIKLIVIDSVQGSGLQASAARQWQGLYQFAALTRAARITTFLVAHVTKKNEIAGPRSTEHNIDAAFVLRKAGHRRHLGVPKNRFGREVHRFFPLELDEPTLTLKVSLYAESFTAVARGYLPGMGLAEVQGAVTLPRWGAPPKVMAPNLPRREIEQLIACIGQIPGLELDQLDFSVQCRLPGERRYGGVLGLPLCLSLISSFLQLPIPANQLHIGEVDLCRSIRDLPPLVLEDLATAIADGRVSAPVRLLLPPSAASQLPREPGIELVPCRRLDDALYITWPDLR